MPKDTFYRLPEEKRDRIMDAAMAEFQRVSYEDASINKIIKSAGISRGSFYQYFEDKEDLFFYIIKEGSEHIKESLDRILSGVDGDIFRFIYVLIDKFYEFYQSEKCGEIRMFLQREDSFRMILTVCQEAEQKEEVERKIEQNLLEKIDFSTLLLQDEEEQICFLSILSAVLRDTVRKIFQQGDRFDISDECREICRKMQTLERHYRREMK